MSNLRSHYLPISFAVNKFLYVNHTHASIFYSQAANLPIYLINTPSPVFFYLIYELFSLKMSLYKAMT